MFFIVIPFIFHCIFPSFRGTCVFVVIVAVMVLFCPAVMWGLFIFIVGFCFVTFIVRLILVLSFVIVIWYFPVLLKV